MKDQILHTTQSIHTRLKWSIDLKCNFEQNVNDLEVLISKKYSSLSRKEIIDLILQCRVVGLFRLANDFEVSLGECDKEELKKMYSQIN